MKVPPESLTDSFPPAFESEQIHPVRGKSSDEARSKTMPYHVVTSILKITMLCLLTKNSSHF